MTPHDTTADGFAATAQAPAAQGGETMRDMDAKVLRRAADLIAVGFTKHAEARDGDGLLVDATDPNAVCFCMSGAINRAWCEATRREAPLTHAEFRYGAHLDGIRAAVLAEFKALGYDPHKILGGNTGWNNAPERRADEVAALLRHAAARCDGVSPAPEATPHHEEVSGASRGDRAQISADTAR